jgi:hypothetical protein
MNRSWLFWNVMQGGVVVADVSGYPIGSIKGQGVQVLSGCLTVEIGPIWCPETAVTNYQSTLRDIPQERISHLHCGGKPEIKQAMNTLKYFMYLNKLRK